MWKTSLKAAGLMIFFTAQKNMQKCSPQRAVPLSTFFRKKWSKKAPAGAPPSSKYLAAFLWPSAKLVPPAGGPASIADRGKEAKGRLRKEALRASVAMRAVYF